jgi:hypothetical protein
MMSDLALPAPKVIPEGEWYKRVHGPFVGVTQQLPSRRLHYTPWSELLQAQIEAIETTWLDGEYDVRVAVLDRDGWMVYGAALDSAFVRQHGMQGWFGCEFGFATLESMNLVDPVEVALRESVARTANQPDWWREEPNG